MNQIEVNTRTIEVGVNATANLMAQMGLNQVEAVIVAGHLVEHLQKTTGLKYADLISNFKADKKLDLVPPPK